MFGNCNHCCFCCGHPCTMEYYSAIKKNEILLFATTWMELEGILLSEISQRKILYNITYMWNLKNKTSEYDKKETYSQI